MNISNIFRNKLDNPFFSEKITTKKEDEDPAMRALSKAGMSAGSDMVELINPAGAGDFVLICEHASNFIPPGMNTLGLNGDLLNEHIAWDAGALMVAKAMSAELDAPLVAARFSRLVYDCNRAPDTPDTVPVFSEHHEIPGNTGLAETDLKQREMQFYAPFANAVTQSLNQRMNKTTKPVVMTIGSVSV